MKLVVLGASGGVGRLLVEQASSAGHQVVAVARASSAVPAFSSGVEVRRCDLTDAAALQAVFVGADAVLSGLGLRLAGLAPWHRPEVPDLMESSTRAIVEAMKGAGVRRVVAVSSSGVGESAAMIPGFFKIMMKATALRHVMPALETMEQQFRSSGLEACFVRPTGLTDGPATGTIVEPTRLVGEAKIARADVAAWMLAEVQRPQMRPAVVVTTTGGA